MEDSCMLRGTRKHENALLSELYLNIPGIVRMKSLARLHVW